VQISALVDGELSGAELDRANAHLAACERCRAEAAELRQLKRDLRALAIPLFDPASEGVGGLAEAGADEALTRRLLAMVGPGGPVPSRRLRRETRRDRSGNQRSRSGPARGRGAGGPGGAGDPGGAGGARVSGRQRASGPPYSVRPRRSQGAPRRRGRYVLWSALSVVVVGIGAAAFGMGGGPAEPAPRITPQLEMFSIEHAINSGDVPFPDPTQAPAQPSPGVTRP
jgi:anti-sigma factor RsiW